MLGYFFLRQNWDKGHPAEPPESAVTEVLITNSLCSRGNNILICQKLIGAFYFI